VFWIAARFFERREPIPAPGQRLFDIRDGARLIRVPIADILAISSAGNYVEFVLRDGRKPLMRTPLSTLEAELAADGFVRTHRSWIVNAMQVTGLKPEGSGDYEVELGRVNVPLSRRFPEALAKLRAG
jgi:DNA-binding LytR/AlgR family response regulator